MNDRLNSNQHHRLILLDREQLEVVGAINVISFDAHQIIVDTNQGILKLTGEDLHVKHLDLQAEKLTVEGLIVGMEYSENRGLKGKGLIGRLFR